MSDLDNRRRLDLHLYGKRVEDFDAKALSEIAAGGIRNPSRPIARSGCCRLPKPRLGKPLKSKGSIR